LTVTGATGAFANSGLTYNGTNLYITGSVTASTTLEWGPYSNARTQTGNAFARLFGNYIGSGTIPNDFFITNNILTPTITETGITATARDFAGVSGTAAIRLSAPQSGSFYGTITLYTGVSNTALTPSLVVSNTYASIGTSNLPSSPGLNVNGGLVLSNGFRPLYSNVAAATTLEIGATYGTYFNITTTATVAVRVSSQFSIDSNAHWVFRNNTGTYLSIAISYSNVNGTGPTLMTIPPANSVTFLYTGATSGTSAYVFF